MWQPIETAPKDGSNFLQYSPRRGVTMNHWHAFKTEEGGCLNHIVFNDMPTHWMPLPEPPK
jgi:hypothetical protein